MAKFATNIFSQGRPYVDTRQATAREVNTAFAPPEITTRAAWEQHAEEVRRRILLSGGLLPEPERQPISPKIFGRTVLKGCSIDRVWFESRPGVIVTGNLYRPEKWHGKRPAILCPHGHWQRGRLEQTDVGNIPGRCVGLARMGFVAFSYDLFGSVDSLQTPHRWSNEDCLRMQLYGVSTFGIQLWSSLRAVDFVAGLTDVDENRIGCTGASGGATQTYFLAAVEPRIKALAPVCMLSLHYQGGCACEEPPLIHLNGISTLDVVGACAPRPVLLPSVTQDWTNQNPATEIKVIKDIYDLYGASDKVSNVHLDLPHNYGKAFREHVYAFFARTLWGKTGTGKRIAEAPLPKVTNDMARVFPDGKLPSKFKRNEAFLAKMRREESAAFAKPPKTAAELRKLRKTWTPIYQDVIGYSEQTDTISVGMPGYLKDGKDYRVNAAAISPYGSDTMTPGIWIQPKPLVKSAQTALVLCEKGKAGLFKRNKPGPLLQGLLDRNIRVLALDLLGTGEAITPRGDDRPSPDLPTYYAFNPSLLAHRIQDILNALTAIRQYCGVRKPTLIGSGWAGVAALLARTVAKDLSATAIDLTGCPVSDDAFWRGPMHHPLLRHLGDLRGALALGPTSPLLLAGADTSTAAMARTTYRLQKKEKSLRITKAATADTLSKWVAT
jgi:pimeloyl-ACP methyl ester carboxylesterase